MEPHPAVAHLSPLLGIWKGDGRGDYPTIDAFEYSEEVTIGHVGKPFLAYSQRTRGADGSGLHAECGYWRPDGETGLEVLVAHPSGIAEILIGEVHLTASGLTATLRAGPPDPDPEGAAGRSGPAGRVILTPTAKQVDSTVRRITVDGDTLSYEVHMAAVGQPMTPHLTATLRRAG